MAAEPPAADIAAAKPSIPAHFLGIYHGIQEAYYLKNQFGDDMVINGRKVPVPSIDHKFLLKEDGTVSLQQINLEDQGRVYYEGTWTLVEESDEVLKLDCKVSDGGQSNPSYRLVINKSDLTGSCFGDAQPVIELQKRDLEQEGVDAAEYPRSGAPAVRDEVVDGSYVYRDNSVQLLVNVSGESWSGVTRIISGFGEDYDNANAEFENGVVNGSDLYDASGMVRIGYVRDGRLITTIGGQSVILMRR